MCGSAEVISESLFVRFTDYFQKQELNGDAISPGDARKFLALHGGLRHNASNKLLWAWRQEGKLEYKSGNGWRILHDDLN